VGEDWRAWFDCGIVTPSAFPETLRGEYPVVGVCRELLRDDFHTAIEVVPIIDPLGRKHVAEMTAAAGAVLVSVAAVPYALQGIRPAADDPGVWQESLDRAKRFVDDAYEMGAPLQQVTGGPDPGPDGRAAARRRLVEFYARLCEHAISRRPERPLSLSIEPVDRDVQLKGLIGPTEEAVEVVEAVRRRWPNVGLTLDLSHILELGESPEQAVAIGKDYLDHIHLANTVLEPGHPLYGDQHPQFGVPHGVVDVPAVARFLTILREANFFTPQAYGARPVVSVEVRPGPGQDPHLVYTATKRMLRQAFAMVDWTIPAPAKEMPRE